ncbi:MAG: long-chain fatty acid--CoA ligase [Porphyromonas sp.]|nr:long-chain fatty acid--CoA ligase [Porphyromonas sp.]
MMESQDLHLSHLSQIIGRLETTFRSHRILKQLNPKTQTWEWLTGEAVAQNCMQAAKGLAQLGLEPGDCIGIYSPNKSEYLYTELGIFALRGVSVPFYSTCSPDQVHFIVCSAGIKVIFVGEQYQYNNAYQVQRERGQIERIIIYDRAVVRQFDDNTSIYYDEFIRIGDSMPSETKVKIRMSEARREDLAVLIYTSGTTGEPKGVQVLHQAFVEQVKRHHEVYPSIGPTDTSVNFLPLSHIFEKAWVYVCWSLGVRVAIVTNPKRIQELMPQIKPTLMCNVPRYWEKVYQGVMAHIDESLAPIASLFRRAIKVGRRYKLDYWNKYKTPPVLLSVEHWIYKHTVYYLLKRATGLQNGRFFPTAGSLLSEPINEFLNAVDIPIIIGYGLSESCATVSAYPMRGFELSSIGEVFEGVEVRIAPDTQEIQLRGETITPGYYYNDQANAEAFTEDGWFRTGDAGRLEGRTLFFTERLKDLYKTANGKYIAPQQIENLLTAHRLFEQVAVVADGYKFVSALIYPNWGLMISMAKERGCIIGDPMNFHQIALIPTVIQIAMAQIEELQAGLAAFEKIKRITLIAEPFSMERNEITPSLKLRRKVIYQHYQEQIEAMYKE